MGMLCDMCRNHCAGMRRRGAVTITIRSKASSFLLAVVYWPLYTCPGLELIYCWEVISTIRAYSIAGTYLLWVHVGGGDPRVVNLFNVGSHLMRSPCRGLHMSYMRMQCAAVFYCVCLQNRICPPIKRLNGQSENAKISGSFVYR